MSEFTEFVGELLESLAKLELRIAALEENPSPRDERRYGDPLWQCNCLDENGWGFKLYEWGTNYCEECDTYCPRLVAEQ